MVKIWRRARPAVRHRVSLRKQAVERAVQILDHLIPRSDTTVLMSFPDLDDNTVGLLRSPACPARLKVLVDNPGKAHKRATALGLNVCLTPKRSARGLWAYLRSKVCASTHGVFGSRPRGPGKYSVSTWHGELGKTSGLAAGERAEFYDRMYASNTTSLAWRVAEVGIHPDAVRITGMPRHMMLRQPRRLLDAEVRRIVWAPTYRVANTGLSRAEGDEEALTAYISTTLHDLQPVLEASNAELWFRAHPASRGAIDASDRVVLATDELLENLGMTFYELLAESDCLVTDVSSVWIDYLLVDKPLICGMPDAAHYLAQRSMTLEPHEKWFPGPIAVTSGKLVQEIRAILGGEDKKQIQRQFLRSVFHPVDDRDPASTIWADIAEVSGEG